jgi:hypothetical protein
MSLGFIPDFQFATAVTPLAGSQLGFTPSWQFDQQLAGLNGEPLDTLNAMFDSWWWKNRKWVALGAVGALGLGILGGLTAILR